MGGEMAKPKVGLLLLTAEWFGQIGASGGSFAELPRALEGDAAQMARALGRELEIVQPGVLATLEQVDRALAAFKAHDVDAMIACQITWGEDRLILKAVQELPNVPLLLWCYTPYTRLPEPMSMPDLFRASGPVGALQASGPLKRLGKKFGFAFGSYESQATVERIVAFCRAARAARSLRGARIGVLPYRCDQMTGTYVDEFRLKKEIGAELVYISTHDYRDMCEQVPAARVEAFVRALKATYAIAENTTEAGLSNGARVSLGLAELVERYDLDAVGIEDVGEELHRVVGLRPCLYVPGLFERAVVSMEAEVGGAVALLILKGLASSPPMYTEIFTYDQAENALLMGHAGIHDVRLAESADEVWIEPDGEYVESEPDSAWMRFRVKGGRVTMLSVFCDVERFKMVIAAGEALGGPPRLLGSPHAYVRLETPVERFFEQCVRTGMTQHWALVHGDVVDELVALAGIVGLDVVLIGASGAG
jgi:L-arabinose isomerase